MENQINNTTIMLQALTNIWTVHMVTRGLNTSTSPRHMQEWHPKYCTLKHKKVIWELQTFPLWFTSAWNNLTVFIYFIQVQKASLLGKNLALIFK